MVEILNPYNEMEFLGDKLSIVDVKAKDKTGRIYQVEVQMLNNPYLPTRIIYAWADIYSQQLQSGQDYSKLRPTYSIWLLAENLLKDDPQYAHEYKLRDQQGRILAEHGGIHLLELKKFAVDHIENEEQRWLKFFKDGDQLDDTVLPEWMTTDEMRQAMSTLKLFSEKERNYHEYQARQNYLREQRAIQHAMEQTRHDLQQARHDLDEALRREQEAIQREQAAQAGIERLKALLTQRPT